MATSDHVDLEPFMRGVKLHYLGQPEFVQTGQEVAEDIFDTIRAKWEYREHHILWRFA